MYCCAFLVGHLQTILKIIFVECSYPKIYTVLNLSVQQLFHSALVFSLFTPWVTWNPLVKKGAEDRIPTYARKDLICGNRSFWGVEWLPWGCVRTTAGEESIISPFLCPAVSMKSLPFWIPFTVLPNDAPRVISILALREIFNVVKEISSNNQSYVSQSILITF